MSSENKTRYEVQEILCTVMKEGLSSLGIDTSSFTFMEADQTLPTAKKNFILFKLNSSKRVGWPQISNERDTTGGYRRERFIEQQEWEIRVVKRLPSSVTSTYVSEDDIANALKVWFNGIGNVSMRKNGISNLIVADSRQEKTKDDSQLNIKPGTFSVSVIVPKTVIFRHNVTELIKPDVKPI